MGPVFLLDDVDGGYFGVESFEEFGFGCVCAADLLAVCFILRGAHFAFDHEI